MKLELIRHAYLPDVTLGTMFVGPTLLHTLEEPWRPDPDGPGGQSFISCVPDGEYNLHPHNGKFQDVFCLSNPALGVYRFPGDIPHGQMFGRAVVLIHSGNTVEDIEGCILIGISAEVKGDKHRVNESRKALERFRLFVPRTNEHTLLIRTIAGTSEKK